MSERSRRGRCAVRGARGAGQRGILADRDLTATRVFADYPAIIACLEESGVEVAEGATPDEIRQATDKLFRDSMEASNDAATVWCYPEDF